MSEIDISKEAIDRLDRKIRTYAADAVGSHRFVMDYFVEALQIMHNLRAALTAKEAELAEVKKQLAFQKEVVLELGDRNAKLFADYRAAEARGRNEGLEMAAKWHDEQAAEWKGASERQWTRLERSLYARRHRSDARALRALMTSPAPDREAGEWPPPREWFERKANENGPDECEAGSLATADTEILAAFNAQIKDHGHD